MQIKLVISFLLIIILPPLMMVVLKLNSMTLGLLLSALLLVAINYKYFTSISFNIKPFAVVALILLALLFDASYSFVVYGITKPLISVLAMGMLIFCAYFLSLVIRKTGYYYLQDSFFIVIIVLLLFALLAGSDYKIDFGDYNSKKKIAFPYGEISHLGLAVATFLLPYSIVANKVRVLLGSLVTVFLAFYLFSLVFLVVGATAFILLGLRVFKFKMIIATFLVLLSIALIISITDNLFGIEYFDQRLNFDHNNRSVLVFLQGFELAYLNLINTNGLGLGFQMLGKSITHAGEYTLSICGSANLQDGSFVMSKLIAEFGIVGVLITIFYLRYLIKFIFIIPKKWAIIIADSSTSNKYELKKQLLVMGMVAAFFIEFFMRGYGYFSLGFLLLMTSLFIQYRQL